MMKKFVLEMELVFQIIIVSVIMNILGMNVNFIDVLINLIMIQQFVLEMEIALQLIIVNVIMDILEMNVNFLHVLE